MKRAFRVGIIILIALVVFFFVPFIQTGTVNLGGGPTYVGWVSLSYSFFQCGAATGGYSIQVPNGGTGNGVEPFWARSPGWNCEFPHLMA